MTDFVDTALRAFPLLAKGALITLQISIVGVAIGLCLGTLLGILNCSQLRKITTGKIIGVFVTVFRGTPLFVQLLFVYFAIPELTGVDLAPVSAGIITLGLNSAAYLSETIRGGINSVAPGQWEGAFTLGYTKSQALRFIILPQALKSSLPAIVNELVTLVKDSSIMMIIGVPELIKVGRDIVARELNPTEIYTLVALSYLAMTMAIGFAGKKLEERLS